MAYAPQVTNVGTQGQDARYDTTGTWFDPDRGLYTDGYYHYREQGSSVLAEDRPNSYVDGLRAANDNHEGGGGGGGGSSAFGNPYFQQFQAATQAQQAADLADTRAQIQQLLIQFGMVPGDFQDKIGALDDTIRALIQKNTDTGISAYARLQEGKNDTLNSTVGRLSSKGLRRSGAKGYRLNRNQLDYDRTFSDSIAALLGNANSLQSGYAGRETQRQQSLAQMLASIFQNYRGGGGGGYAPAPPRPQQPQWFQVSEPTATPTQALQNVQNTWQQYAAEPGFANYWAQTTSPVAPSSPLWGQVKAY